MKVQDFIFISLETKIFNQKSLLKYSGLNKKVLETINIYFISLYYKNPFPVYIIRYSKENFQDLGQEYET